MSAVKLLHTFFIGGGEVFGWNFSFFYMEQHRFVHFVAVKGVFWGSKFKNIISATLNMNKTKKYFIKFHADWKIMCVAMFNEVS